MKRLRDWDYFNSRAYEEQQFLCDDARKEAGNNSPVVRFERAFVKRARLYGVPVYCTEMVGDCCTILHCQWLDRLSLGELNIFLELGLGACDQVVARYGSGPGKAYQWEVTPHLKEAEDMATALHLGFPVRERSRDEVNTICGGAAASAQRIVRAQEAVEDAQRLLRSEVDRVSRSRSAT